MIISLILAILSFASPVGIILGSLGTWYFTKKRADTKKRNLSIGLLAVSIPLFVMLIAGFKAEEAPKNQSVVDTKISVKESKPELDNDKAVETELIQPEYQIEYHFINDPSAYSGRPVCEAIGKGSFILEDENFLDYAMETLNKEAKNGLEKYPESQMVRVMIYDKTNEFMPAVAGTFNVIDGNLVLSEDTASYIPLLE